MKPKQADNGASPIIDTLLIRMSELDRFSDDECAISGKELLPLDVVVDEDGDFGIVSRAVGYSVAAGDKLGWGVSFVGVMPSVTYEHHAPVRTIYETEGVEARAYLAKYLGGRRWY
ncbi:hypothetical protein [Moraxella lacunata]|uniref:Uncharacterized protein n=1 Tax=Moraxella lacunata TaxID=477 RepID=A0A1V4GUU2_MORLA|nr:hypothetical protein [Moraxella lacunata]OPH36392.1 hypothetical protein B5J94_07310 [Moraxella lacunata]